MGLNIPLTQRQCVVLLTVNEPWPFVMDLNKTRAAVWFLSAVQTSNVQTLFANDYTKWLHSKIETIH